MNEFSTPVPFVHLYWFLSLLKQFTDYHLCLDIIEGGVTSCVVLTLIRMK